MKLLEEILFSTDDKPPFSNRVGVSWGRFVLTLDSQTSLNARMGIDGSLAGQPLHKRRKGLVNFALRFRER